MPSMSRVGSALDNAISESFVSTLKSEIGVSRYPTRQAARASVFEFIELFYNRVRRHSSLGYLSPAEYEEVFGAACGRSAPGCVFSSLRILLVPIWGPSDSHSNWISFTTRCTLSP